MGYNSGCFVLNLTKERKIMKRILVIGMTIMLLLAACAPRMDEVVEQAVVMVEEAAGEEVEIPEKMESAPSDSGGSGQEYVSWSYFDLPAQFPEYTDGRIQKPFMLQDWYPIIIGIEDTSVKAIEDYVQRAIGEGFELLWERVAQGDEDLGWAVNKSTDEEHYSIMLSYYEDFDGIPNAVNLVVDVREK